MENPATTEDSGDETTTDINRPTPTPPLGEGPGESTRIVNASSAFFNKEYEIY